MLGVGLWAWTEKDMFQNLSKLSQIPLDPALLLILAGTLIFIIGFTGCIGALRENTFLLLVVGVCSESMQLLCRSILCFVLYQFLCHIIHKCAIVRF